MFMILGLPFALFANMLLRRRARRTQSDGRGGRRAPKMSSNAAIFNTQARRNTPLGRRTQANIRQARAMTPGQRGTTGVSGGRRLRRGARFATFPG